MLRAARSTRRGQSPLLRSEAAGHGALQRPSAGGSVDRSVGERVSTPGDLRTGERDELHRLAFPRLEAHGVAGGGVEPPAGRLPPGGGGRAGYPEEMVVAADLNRPDSRL